MRIRILKVLFGIIGCVCSACMFLVGCHISDKTSESGNETTVEIVFSKYELVMLVGERNELYVDVLVDGEKIKRRNDFTVTDASIVTIEDGIVVAIQEGETEIQIEENEVVKSCIVRVYGETEILYNGIRQDINMSLARTSFSLPTEIDASNITYVAVDCNPIGFSTEGNKLSINCYDLADLKMCGEKDVRLLCENKLYAIKSLLITKIIYTASQLNQMAEMIEASKTDAYTFTLKNEATIYKTSGYFVLGDDIDYNWETWIGPASGGFFSRQAYLNTNNGLGAYSAYGFNGVFDGRGHTVSNVTFQTSRINWNNAKGSMFGAIGQNGRVENVNITGTMSGSATGVFGSACFGTIEDVQVTMMPHGTNAYAVDTEYDGGVICCLVQAATIKNVVTKVLGDARGLDACFGVVFATAYSNGNGLTLDNIYSVVIGKYVNRRDSSESAMSWGTQTSTAYQVPNTLMGALVDAGNAGFYTTEEAAKAATGIDVTGFDAEYWTIPTTGIPVFKTEDVSF